MANIEVVYRFLENTIMGQESGLYKVIGSAIVNVDPIMLYSIKVDYYNGVYKSLILDDSEYVTNIFNAMTCDHSKVCLLQQLIRVDLMIHESLIRNKDKAASYELWMESIRHQLQRSKPIIVKQLQELLSHECKGIDIKTCNPNNPLFYIK